MLKRIFSYMKQYKKYACLALLCIAVEAVLELMVPMIMADLIDNGADGRMCGSGTYPWHWKCKIFSTCRTGTWR